MNDITQSLGTLYHPVKALVVFRAKANDSCYVEAYDMDSIGRPINAHPLGIAESKALAKALDASGGLKRSFLKPKGLLPEKLLYINPEHNGYAIWYTPPMKTDLYFIDGLNIPCGKANVPALIWKAGKKELYLYAFNGREKPTEDTPLCHAPFFNLHPNGKVCMGTVAVNIKEDCSLEEFIGQWQAFFFNSYFSHLIAEHNPVKGNIVQLWQSLSTSSKKFPERSLKKTSLTLKKLLK